MSKLTISGQTYTYLYTENSEHFQKVEWRALDELRNSLLALRGVEAEVLQFTQRYKMKFLINCQTCY